MEAYGSHGGITCFNPYFREAPFYGRALLGRTGRSPLGRTSVAQAQAKMERRSSAPYRPGAGAVARERQSRRSNDNSFRVGSATAGDASQQEEQGTPLAQPASTTMGRSAAVGRGGGGARRDTLGRTSMSWRRSSPLSGAAVGKLRADSRRRTSSQTDEKERERVDKGTRRTGEEEDPAGYTEEELLLHFQDVRDELELSGHNLTSVLNNPRETFIDSLYEAAFEAEPPLPDMDVVRANVPHGLREIAPQVGLCLSLLSWIQQ